MAANVSRSTPQGYAQAAAPTQKVSRSNYQTIVLMEFIACILLTAITPIAKKKTADGLSPYAGQDLVKLGAITLLFFILAALAASNATAGKVAAGFGAIILITDGMLEATNLVNDVAVFTGGTGTKVTATGQQNAGAPGPQNAGAAPAQGA